MRGLSAVYLRRGEVRDSGSGFEDTDNRHTSYLHKLIWPDDTFLLRITEQLSRRKER